MCAKKSNSNILYTDIAQAYWNDICDSEPLPIEEQKRLMGLIKAGDKEAYNLFVESFLRLVVSRAKKYCNNFDSFMDLIQEGNIGLLKAVEHFNPEKGFCFSTYAIPWIDKYIRKDSCRTGHPIRIPPGKVSDINHLIVTQELMLQENGGQKVTTEDLAERMNLSVEKVVELQLLVNPILSVDLRYLDGKNDGENTLLKKLPNRSAPTPEEILFAHDVKEQLNRIMEENLTKTECKILKLRYGIDNNGLSETLESVSAKCGITLEGVRKAEHRAIRKLQKAMIQAGLTQVDFLY